MRIRYFAWLKQRAGCAEETIDLPESIATVGELMAHLGSLHPRFAEACEAKGVVRCAVNQENAGPETSIKPSDEVAFFPPITGG